MCKNYNYTNSHFYLCPTQSTLMYYYVCCYVVIIIRVCTLDSVFVIYTKSSTIEHIYYDTRIVSY